MSIDAIIEAIEFTDNEYAFWLGKRGKDNPGQSRLILEPVVNPENLHVFLGREIRGNSSILLVGDQEIAHRVGYTHIKLLPDWEARLDAADNLAKMISENNYTDYFGE